MPGKIRRNLCKTQTSRWVAFYVLIKMVQLSLIEDSFYVRRVFSPLIYFQF